MNERNKSLLNVPLPGMDVPADRSGADDPALRVPRPVPAPSPPPPPPAGPGVRAKVHAHKSRRVESSFETEQSEEFTFQYEGDLPVRPVMPVQPLPPNPAPTPPPSNPADTSPPPMDVDPLADSAPLPLAQPSNPMAWMPLAAFAAIGAVALIASLLILQQPLTLWTQGKAYERQSHLIEAQQQAQYQALDDDVRAGVGQLDERLGRLDSNVKTWTAQTQATLGIPLERLRSHPGERPRELDLAILRSPDLATRWSGLINAASRSPQSDPVYLAVQDLRNRMQEQRLIPADRERIAGLLTQMAREEEMAAQRTQDVQELKEWLEGQRFQEGLQAPAGRSVSASQSATDAGSTIGQN